MILAASYDLPDPQPPGLIFCLIIELIPVADACIGFFCSVIPCMPDRLNRMKLCKACVKLTSARLSQTANSFRGTGLPTSMRSITLYVSVYAPHKD